MKINVAAPSLKDAEESLLRVKGAKEVTCPHWSLSEICLHCAQTIDYSISGYPQLKPVIIRATVGRLAIRKFLGQGYMKHNLSAPVPGGQAFKEDKSISEGMDELFSAIQRFRDYNGEFKLHLLFGKLSKEEYDSYFAMHIADHLSELSF